MLFYALEYEGFDHTDLHVLDEAASRGGFFKQRWQDVIRSWYFLNAYVNNWAVRMTVSHVEPGDSLESLVGSAQVEWTTARRGYPDDVIEAGIQLLREPLPPQPEY